MEVRESAAVIQAPGRKGDPLSPLHPEHLPPLSTSILSIPPLYLSSAESPPTPPYFQPPTSSIPRTCCCFRYKEEAQAFAQKLDRAAMEHKREIEDRELELMMQRQQIGDMKVRG